MQSAEPAIDRTDHGAAEAPRYPTRVGSGGQRTARRAGCALVSTLWLSTSGALAQPQPPEPPPSDVPPYEHGSEVEPYAGETGPTVLPDPCRAKPECTNLGRCTTRKDACVATDGADCAASAACRKYGFKCKLDVKRRLCVDDATPKARFEVAETSKRPPEPTLRSPVMWGFGLAFSSLGLGLLSVSALPFAAADQPDLTEEERDNALRAGGIMLGTALGLMFVGTPLVLYGGQEVPPVTVSIDGSGVVLGVVF